MTIIPDIITPKTTEINAFFLGMLKSHAARLPVYAPVTGSGIITNSISPQKPYFLIFVSAFFTGIAQHNVIFGFLAWFSLIPFLYTLLRLNELRKILYYSFIWGFIYNFITVFWIGQNIGTNIYIAIASMLATIFILCFNTIFTTIIWYKLQYNFKKYSLYIFALSWVAVEYIRTYGVLGFPWISLANTQTSYYYLIQNAEIFGIYGISFWVLLINVFLYKSIFENSSNNKYLLLSCFIFPFVTGYFIIQKLDEKIVDGYQVSIIQPNVNLIDKRDLNYSGVLFKSLIESSKKCIDEGTKLVIWPESAMPYQNIQNEHLLDYITENLFKDNDSYLLTGNVIYDDDKIYNSAVLINSEGIVKFYNKQQLVPMGEYVPLSDKLEFLSNINLGQANFSVGLDDVVFESTGHNFASMICFESTFPHINRNHAIKGADTFIYLVNDGWYTTLPEPRQHAKQSIFRAIENRNTVIRCANTGLSSVIDPSGIIREQTTLNTEQTITTFIRKSNTITFYTLYGNVFAYLVLITLGIIFIMSIYKDGNKS